MECKYIHLYPGHNYDGRLFIFIHPFDATASLHCASYSELLPSISVFPSKQFLMHERMKQTQLN